MSSHLPWFRFYVEAIDDEKLGLLAFEDRWHFVAILCLKGKGILDSEPNPELLARKVALKMGLTCSELGKVADRLASMKLIVKETFQPCAWDARQMQSDNSKERVQAYRERMKQVKRYGNVTVTTQELDTDTDKDKECVGSARANEAPLGPAIAGPHTQISVEFLTEAKKHRPDIDANAAWALFCEHYPATKRGIARWTAWVKRETTKPAVGASTPTTSDPDSRGAVEALGVRLGLGQWDGGLLEPWSAYKARVRATERNQAELCT